MECPLRRTVSGDDTIPHGQRLLHTKDVEGDLGACPEECHSNQRHHPSKRHLFQISAGARLNDRAGLVPVVHGHGPRHRRTSAIHLFQSRQGGQVRARLCVSSQLVSQQPWFLPASSTLQSWEACLTSFCVWDFLYSPAAHLVSIAERGR